MCAKKETVKKKVIKKPDHAATAEPAEKVGKTDAVKTVFRVTGSFRKNKKIQNFTKEVISANKQKAEEYILSIIGSKHRVKRRGITIENIEKISPEQITDGIIKHLVEG